MPLSNKAAAECFGAIRTAIRDTPVEDEHEASFRNAAIASVSILEFITWRLVSIANSLERIADAEEAAAGRLQVWSEQDEQRWAHYMGQFNDVVTRVEELERGRPLAVMGEANVSPHLAHSPFLQPLPQSLVQPPTASGELVGQAPPFPATPGRFPHADPGPDPRSDNGELPPRVGPPTPRAEPPLNNCPEVLGAEWGKPLKSMSGILTVADADADKQFGALNAAAAGLHPDTAAALKLIRLRKKHAVTREEWDALDMPFQPVTPELAESFEARLLELRAAASAPDIAPLGGG